MTQSDDQPSELLQQMTRVSYARQFGASFNTKLIAYCSVVDKEGHTWPCSTIRLCDPIPTGSSASHFHPLSEIQQIQTTAYLIPRDVRTGSNAMYKDDSLPVFAVAPNETYFLIPEDCKFLSWKRVKGSELKLHSQYGESHNPEEFIDYEAALRDGHVPRQFRERVYVGQWRPEYEALFEMVINEPLKKDQSTK